MRRNQEIVRANDFSSLLQMDLDLGVFLTSSDREIQDLQGAEEFLQSLPVLGRLRRLLATEKQFRKNTFSVRSCQSGEFAVLPMGPWPNPLKSQPSP